MKSKEGGWTRASIHLDSNVLARLNFIYLFFFVENEGLQRCEGNSRPLHRYSVATKSAAVGVFLLLSFLFSALFILRGFFAVFIYIFRF